MTECAHETIARSNHGLLLRLLRREYGNTFLQMPGSTLSGTSTSTHNHSKSTVTVRGLVSPRRYKRKTPDSTKSIAPHPHGRRRLKWEMVVRPCKRLPALRLLSILPSAVTSYAESEV
jgi:hypothetical protein